MPLMSLGMFPFEMGTLAYQELGRKSSWRHASSDRFGARPATQYLGPGDDDVSLSGAILPGFAGSFASLETLREMAGTGDAWPLVDGGGRVFGNYRIEGIGEGRSVFMDDGAARRGDFSIELKRVS
jgi:phage protein U